MRNNSKFELFRMITPALITLALAILSAIYSDLNKVKETVTNLQINMSAVQTQISELKQRGR